MIDRYFNLEYSLCPPLAEDQRQHILALLENGESLPIEYKHLLFQAMVGAGIPDQGGPIGVMTAEHMQGRQFIRQMEEAITGEEDRPKFARAARGYIDLLRNHIQKENNVLFPMAEKVLDGSQLERLYKGFEEHEEKVIGHGWHEELHTMLKSLQEKHPADL